MTQRPSGSRNAGRINCFPTKTLWPFLSQSILSQSILSQSILSQSRGAPQAGGGDDPCLVDTAGSGAGEPERKRLGGSESGIECPLLPVDMYADLLSVSY
jgi:hypothetical protein